jgi:hypothetical protein
MIPQLIHTFLSILVNEIQVITIRSGNKLNIYELWSRIK